MDWKIFGLNAITSTIANLAMGSVGSYFKGIPEARVSAWLVRFGQAFGPEKLGRHWSQLSGEEQAEWKRKLPNLGTTHSDFLPGFQWIKRTLLFWEGSPYTMSDVIAGNVSEMKPIPPLGEWYVVKGFMSSTGIEGIHDRIGWRWDDMDWFMELSVSVKIRK